MTTHGSDINLQIALTLLQFIALALPAIYLFAQTGDIDYNTNKYQIIRGSVSCYVLGALLLLLSIGSNIQAFPTETLVTGYLEALVLTLSILFVALGTAQFGLSVVINSVFIQARHQGFLKLYIRAIRKTIKNFRR